MIISMNEGKKWQVQRAGQIRGPYPFSVIEKLARAGRLKETDELSDDSENWKLAGDFVGLFEGLNSEILLKDDERSGHDRRDKDDLSSNHNQQNRQSKERRQVESDEEISRRVGRAKLLETIKASRVEDHFPVLAIITSILIIVILGFIFNPVEDELVSDCDAPPQAGVIWDNCKFGKLILKRRDLSGASIRNAVLARVNFQDAILVGSNFSYTDLSKGNFNNANLENAILKGANLQSVNFKSVSLIGADLSHADLRGANLENADLSRTVLDEAIWKDGRLCASDSVGTCRE